jgi:hypothetical protein
MGNPELSIECSTVWPHSKGNTGNFGKNQDAACSTCAGLLQKM